MDTASSAKLQPVRGVIFQAKRAPISNTPSKTSTSSP